MGKLGNHLDENGHFRHLRHRALSSREIPNGYWIFCEGGQVIFIPFGLGWALLLEMKGVGKGWTHRQMMWGKMHQRFEGNNCFNHSNWQNWKSWEENKAKKLWRLPVIIKAKRRGSSPGYFFLLIKTQTLIEEAWPLLYILWSRRGYWCRMSNIEDHKGNSRGSDQRWGEKTWTVSGLWEGIDHKGPLLEKYQKKEEAIALPPTCLGSQDML